MPYTSVLHVDAVGRDGDARRAFGDAPVRGGRGGAAAGGASSACRSRTGARTAPNASRVLRMARPYANDAA
jgi:hypothetical protein